jgi:ATP-dependent Clp protease ATP-binding subunit ClpA
MFERFTAGARTAVVRAQAEARALGHGWIGTEHLLLAAVHDPEAPLTRRLADLGLGHDRLRAEVAATLGGHHDDESALRGFGIDLGAVRARVEEQFGPGALEPAPPARSRGLRARLRRRGPDSTCVPGGHIPFSRSAKKALELALRESAALDDREIRLEHLVLGVVRADGLATTVLTRLGVATEDVRRVVLDGPDRAA